MFFDHKTKTFSGRVEEITPERRAFLEEQVKLGLMASTKHPSQEELDEYERNKSDHRLSGDELSRLLRALKLRD